VYWAWIRSGTYLYVFSLQIFQSMLNLLNDTQSDLSLPVFGLLVVAMVMLNTVGVVDILGPLSDVLTIDVFLVGFVNATVDFVT